MCNSLQRPWNDFAAHQSATEHSLRNNALSIKEIFFKMPLVYIKNTCLNVVARRYILCFIDHKYISSTEKQPKFGYGNKMRFK